MEFKESKRCILNNGNKLYSGICILLAILLLYDFILICVDVNHIRTIIGKLLNNGGLCYIPNKYYCDINIRLRLAISRCHERTYITV